MSGLEKEELHTRMQGMTTEEQAIAAKALPDDVLWGELYHRFLDKSSQLEDIIERINRSGEGLPDHMKIGPATDQSYRT